MPATAVLTPTTRRSLVTSAPPELPGFREASVWMTLSIVRTVSPARAGSERPSAETTPAVTEPAKPLGLPIATTSCPTRRRSASPSVAGVRSWSSVRTTARSVSGSAPMGAKRVSRPSVNDATPLRVPPRLPVTTCADVSRKPSRLRTIALPAPMATSAPSRRRPCTRRFATEGASASATPDTVRE